MERPKVEYRKLILAGLIIFYSVGVVIHLLEYFADFLSYLTPIFLLSIFLVVITEETVDKRFLVWLIIAYFFTFLSELIGVKTGYIFGNYRYGENLGVKIFDVPLIIGMNWISLILGSIGFASVLKGSLWMKTVLTGFLMIGFDLILENIAPKLNYWFWQNGTIPMQNFLAWFIISSILSYFYFSLGLQKRLLFARYNFIIQFVFFVSLLISHLFFW